MKDPKSISAPVQSRLPRYYRFLCDLQAQGVSRISSKELAGIMGLTASQIRQDLNCFGEFGQQGYGYHVEHLKNELAAILGLDDPKDAILIGAGNLGTAVAKQLPFDALGFRLTAIFDRSPTLEGKLIRGLPVHPVRELRAFCEEKRPAMAILCVPGDQAPKLTEDLFSCGVNSFWNFSHFDIHAVYPDALVENVHLRDSLMKLSYKMNNSKER